MFKKLNKKGFTLAELLIVVAIIAVLVAISIPIFNSQLEKSRDAVTISNVRAAYAQSQTAVLTYTSDVSSGEVQITATKSGNNITGYTVKLTNVATKGMKNDDNYSGLSSELPFVTTSLPMPTEPAAGTHVLQFAYDANGAITAVAWDPS